MKLSEYIERDGLSLAALVRSGEVKPDEIADCARRMIAAANPAINALVEEFEAPLAARADADAPFLGVPFLIKDLVLHAAGQRLEMGSRLCEGLRLPHDTDLMARFRQAGLRTLGRTTTPEFGYCPTTESRAT